MVICDKTCGIAREAKTAIFSQDILSSRSDNSEVSAAVTLLTKRVCRNAVEVKLRADGVSSTVIVFSCRS